MPETQTDSMFKLRLPGALREKLERSAQTKGKTLTSEILERLNYSFSASPNLLNELEEVVFDSDIGNKRLRKDTALLEDRLQDIWDYLYDLELELRGDASWHRLKRLRDED